MADRELGEGTIRIRRERPLWRRVLGSRWTQGLGALALLFIVACIVFYAMLLRGLPSASTLLAYEPPLPTNIRTVDGTPLQSFAREQRVELSYDEFPPLLVDAFISAEDKTFFKHHGVDITGFGAAVIDYISKMGTGQRARGGSTITQQVAKNLLVGNQYSVSRKLKEAFLAYRIENTLNKKQILELYLNQIFLGRNAYGVEAAAQAYFGKDVTDLDLEQMAYLAILPKAPANYTPEHDAERALDRRDYVLREMQKNGYISADQYHAATTAPLETVARTAPKVDAPTDYYTEEVRRELLDRFGETADDGPNSVYAGGLWVRTSFNPAIQAEMARALRDGLRRWDGGRGWAGPSDHVDPGPGWQGRLLAARVGPGYPEWHAAVVLAKAGGEATIGFDNGSTGRMPAGLAALPRRGTGQSAWSVLKPGDVIVVGSEGGAWGLRATPVISGGMVAENPHTGQVYAMQGGWDFRGGSFNRATQAMRQPGSSFKPVVYATALDNGFTPATIVVDGPFCVYQSARLGTKCFRNFGGGYAGPHTMRWGVEQSRNLMTVRTASTVGMDKVVKTAATMGVGTYPPVLAIALGAGETTVQRMVNFYSMLANQGRELKPTLIDYVEDRHGKLIFRADNRPCDGCNAPDWNGGPMPRPPVRARQLMDPLTSYQMLHIMEGVVQRGTATVLRALDRPIFGKTGTTSGPTNVWFVGGSADLVGGVYLGYDRPRPLGAAAQGGRIAAPVFLQFAQAAMKDAPVVPFRAPAGIRMVRVDRASGRRVYGAWPSEDPKSAVIWEAFKPQSEPKRVIKREQAVAPPPASGEQGPARDTEFLTREGGIY
ncbi:MAG: PBP1A family penicillin-binding protein [Sphingomonadaceae bacterium]|nr:PBP1A family penicillin-binding protein [Sphingomonadaceae bacterium]